MGKSPQQRCKKQWSAIAGPLVGAPLCQIRGEGIPPSLRLVHLISPLPSEWKPQCRAAAPVDCHYYVSVTTFPTPLANSFVLYNGVTLGILVVVCEHSSILLPCNCPHSVCGVFNMIPVVHKGNSYHNLRYGLLRRGISSDWSQMIYMYGTALPVGPLSLSLSW